MAKDAQKHTRTAVASALPPREPLLHDLEGRQCLADLSVGSGGIICINKIDNQRVHMSFPPQCLHQLSYTSLSATSSQVPSSPLLSCDLLPKILPEKQQEAEQRHSQCSEQSTGPPPGRALANTPGDSSKERFSTQQQVFSLPHSVTYCA